MKYSGTLLSSLSLSWMRTGSHRPFTGEKARVAPTIPKPDPRFETRSGNKQHVVDEMFISVRIDHTNDARITSLRILLVGRALVQGLLVLMFHGCE
jgi:hypothetical protein